MKKSIIVIPSRIGSTRLPRKPLLDLQGKTLIRRAYEGAKKSKLSSKVIVATDDLEIKKEVLSFGGEAILSPKKLETGTDRIAWVIKNKIKEEYDFIVNVQGDEPMANGEMVDMMVTGLTKEKDEEVVAITLKTKLNQLTSLENPNTVKVVTDKFNQAIYFSRSVIPKNRENLEKTTYFKHLGYYCYRKNFLLQFPKMKQTPLEKSEKLEQLRILENGYKIKVLETKFSPVEINDQKDLLEFKKKLR